MDPDIRADPVMPADGQAEGRLDRFMYRPRTWSGARGRACAVLAWLGFVLGMGAMGLGLGFIPGRDTGVSPPIGGTAPTWLLNGSLISGGAAVILIGLGLLWAPSGTRERPTQTSRNTHTVLAGFITILPFEAGALTAAFVSTQADNWFIVLVLALVMPFVTIAFLYRSSVRSTPSPPGMPDGWPRV